VIIVATKHELVFKHRYTQQHDWSNGCGALFTSAVAVHDKQDFTELRMLRMELTGRFS
jgi:hypothetical protein